MSQPGDRFVFVMGWFGRPVAKLDFNGATFGFDYERGWLMPLESKQRAPGVPPAFIENFLPAVLGDARFSGARAMAAFLASHERYLANIAIVTDPERLEALPFDRLYGRLQQFASGEGVFTGRLHRFGTLTRDVMADMRAVAHTKRLTQFSGAQAKMPMHLAEDGSLSIATDLPSTHILKLPGLERDPHFVRGIVEWTSMRLAAAAGVECAECALVELEAEPRPVLAYLTERFDIPVGPDDGRMIFTEELGSALGLTPNAATMASVNDVIDGLRVLSSDVDADMRSLLRQLVSNYVLENGDFHSRNLALVKVANRALNGFRSVRLAPAYDIMRTRYFSDMPPAMDEREPMHMGFVTGDGDIVDCDLGIEHFQEIAEYMDLEGSAAQHLMEEVCEGIVAEGRRLLASPPAVLARFPQQAAYMRDTVEAAVQCAQRLVAGLAPEAVVRRPVFGMR